MHPSRLAILIPACFFLVFQSAPDSFGNPSSSLPSLVSEYRSLATDCHGDLNLLKRTTSQVQQALPALAQNKTAARDAYITLAKVYFLYGEMEKDKAKKIALYQQCTSYASEAVKLDDQSAEAHFWVFSGLARQSELKGILKSLMEGMAFRVKGPILKAYELNKGDPYILDGLGGYYWKAPRVVGGNKKKARGYLEEAVRREPQLSFSRLTLAKVLLDLGRREEAKEQIEAVLNLQHPSDPNFYWFVNKPEAEDLFRKVASK